MEWEIVCQQKVTPPYCSASFKAPTLGPISELGSNFNPRNRDKVGMPVEDPDVVYWGNVLKVAPD